MGDRSQINPRYRQPGPVSIFRFRPCEMPVAAGESAVTPSLGHLKHATGRVDFMSILVQAAGVQVSHGGNRIFTDVTFDLSEGDRAAIVGANGSGKSPLFRLLTREIFPERGTVSQRRGVSIGFLTQHPEFNPATLV